MTVAVPVYRPTIAVYHRGPDGEWDSTYGEQAATLLRPMPEEDGSEPRANGFRRVVSGGTSPAWTLLAPEGSEVVPFGTALKIRLPGEHPMDAFSATVLARRGEKGLSIAPASPGPEAEVAASPEPDRGLIKLPDPGGYIPVDGPPCVECGAPIFDVVRWTAIVKVEDESGSVVELDRISVACQCPSIYAHNRSRPPFGLEILGTFDVVSGELELFPAPILASEMEPEDVAVEYGPDVMDACPYWEGDEPPTLAGVMVAREWDGDDRKTITARDIAPDVVAIDRPPPAGTSARPLISGRALWHKRADGVPFECPKGVPHDALGWGFEGDDAWRPLRSAKAAGVVVLKSPKSRGKKSTPPPATEIFSL